MKIVIAGGSGQIGKTLVAELAARRHIVTILSRKSYNSPISDKIAIKNWDGQKLGDWCKAIENADVIINLSGASIASGRWTKHRKKELLESRINSTRILAQAVSIANSRPSIFLNASAVGYYGNTGDIELNENLQKGTGFLSDLCGSWEQEALNIRKFGLRVALLRTGVVLDKNGGALKRMILPYRLFAGGHLGSGQQWIPWIHIEDLIKAVIFIIETESLNGPINLTSPNPVTNRIFAINLGKLLHRPSWFTIPSFLLRMILGEIASVVLEGQRALPSKLLSAGFTFKYPSIEIALTEILSNK
jgi:uncharacterized protein